jgi:hypothetical protein
MLKLGIGYIIIDFDFREKMPKKVGMRTKLEK